MLALTICSSRTTSNFKLQLKLLSSECFECLKHFTQVLHVFIRIQLGCILHIFKGLGLLSAMDFLSFPEGNTSFMENDSIHPLVLFPSCHHSWKSCQKRQPAISSRGAAQLNPTLPSFSIPHIRQFQQGTTLETRQKQEPRQ